MFQMMKSAGTFPQINKKNIELIVQLETVEYCGDTELLMKDRG